MKAFKNSQHVSFSSCDLNIIVEGKQYGAHWHILREKSMFFEEFYCRKKTKGKSFYGKTCVRLEGVSSRLMGLFLQYVYTSSSKDEKPFQIELNEVNDVLKFTVMFRLKELQTLKSFSVDETISSLQNSHRMSQLHKNLLKFLYVRTTRYKTIDIANFVAERAYLSADMDSLFNVLEIVNSTDRKAGRLKLLDILITLFTVSLTTNERLEEVKTKEQEDYGRIFKPSSKEFTCQDTGNANHRPLLRTGIIKATVNPQLTTGQSKRLTNHSHQDNGITKNALFCQNFKKRNVKLSENIEQQNTKNTTSKHLRSPRSLNSMLITEKEQNNTNCPNTSATQRQSSCSKPMKATKVRSTANTRITLIKEHLERINEQAQWANTQDKHDNEERVAVKSRIPLVHFDGTRGKGQTTGVKNKPARVDVPKTRAVKPVVRAEDPFYDEERVHSSINVKRVSDKQEKDMDTGMNENNANLAREYQEVARDTSMTRHEKNPDKVRNLNDSKPKLSSEQGRKIMTRKIRKMWKKDIHSTFPMIKSNNSLHEETPNQNIDIQKLMKDEEIWSLNEEGAIEHFSSDSVENKNKSSEKDKSIQTSKTQPQKAKNLLETSQNENVKTTSSNFSQEIPRKRIFLTGGMQKNDYFARKAILELIPKTGSHNTRGAMQHGRYNHGIAQLGNFIYLVGGNSGFFEQLRSVECYSPEHAQWAMRPSMHEARDEFSLVACDGCLFAIGGHNGIQDLRSVEKFKPWKNSWSFVSPMRDYRAGACAVTMDDRSIFVIGGFNGQNYLASVEQYDVTNDVWIPIQPMSTKRAYSCAVLLERTIYIFGGFDGQKALSSCEMFDIKTRTWEWLQDMNTPRMNGTAVCYAGGVFVIGGECDSVFLETVECYNMKNKTWSFVNHLPQPMAGLRACIFLKGSETEKK